VLPALGLGCWAFGGGSYWGAQSQGDVDAVIGRSLELGLDFFDTAEVYNEGASEESLGRALRGRRTEAIIGSKVSPNHAYRDTLRLHCEASLRRLGTDWIDIYMLHWPLSSNSLRHFTSEQARIDRPPTIQEALEALETLRREGKIRHIGLSNFGPVQMAEALKTGVPITINELPYNLMMRAAEFAALPFCRERGIGVLGYSSLMQGILSRRWGSFDELAGVRLRTRHFSGSRPGSRHGEAGIEAEAFAALGAVADLAEGLGVPMSKLALAWAISNPAVTCTLVGCRNLSQLEENVAALSYSLEPEIKRRLDAATAEVKAKLGPVLDYFQSRETARSE